MSSSPSVPTVKLPPSRIRRWSVILSSVLVTVFFIAVRLDQGFSPIGSLDGTSGGTSEIQHRQMMDRNNFRPASRRPLTLARRLGRRPGVRGRHVATS